MSQLPLPAEILVNIFGCLKYYEIPHCLPVCRQFHDVISKNRKRMQKILISSLTMHIYDNYVNITITTGKHSYLILTVRVERYWVTYRHVDRKIPNAATRIMTEYFATRGKPWRQLERGNVVLFTYLPKSHIREVKDLSEFLLNMFQVQVFKPVIHTTNGAIYNAVIDGISQSKGSCVPVELINIGPLETKIYQVLNSRMVSLTIPMNDVTLSGLDTSFALHVQSARLITCDEWFAGSRIIKHFVAENSTAEYCWYFGSHAMKNLLGTFPQSNVEHCSTASFLGTLKQDLDQKVLIVQYSASDAKNAFKQVLSLKEIDN